MQVQDLSESPAGLSQTVSQLRRWGRNTLRPLSKANELNAVSEEIVAQEVDLILGAVLSWSPLSLITKSNEIVPDDAVQAFARCIVRRLAFEPVAYILGEQEFYGRVLKVSPAVLIPRSETELLVERALRLFTPERERFCIVDIGTGSGAILVALLAELREKFGTEYLSHGSIFGIDCSAEALEMARKNLQQHDLPVTLVHGSLFRPLLAQMAERTEADDILILANLPYIPDHTELPTAVVDYEPKLALRGGQQGMELIEELLDELCQVDVSVHVILEVGAGQAPVVAEMLLLKKFSEVQITTDIRNIERIVEAKRSRA